jgi:hypothetical protein
MLNDISEVKVLLFGLKLHEGKVSLPELKALGQTISPSNLIEFYGKLYSNTNHLLN